MRSGVQLIAVAVLGLSALGCAFGTAFLIAHESAHLWNAQLFRHLGSGNDWLHEGSADAFALHALRELNVTDDDQYWAEQSRQVSKCLLGRGEVKAGTAGRVVTVRCGEPQLPKRPAYLHLLGDAPH